MKEFKLNNGVSIPSVGIGTFLLEPNDAYNSVKEALKQGCRLIDTANVYVNERAVGRAIKDSNVDRKDIFVSTKLWPTEYENENAIQETLNRLGLDYIDLLFLHQPAGSWQKAYKTLEKAYKEGVIKSIGISNFEGEYIEELLKDCEITPQIIQAECHPSFPQDELRKTTDPKDIRIMAWFPLGGQGQVKQLLENEVIVELAEKYQKSPAQIVLRWHNEIGFIVIPGSKNAEHIKDNLNIQDFELTKEDLEKIAKLNTNTRHYHATKELLDNYANWPPKYETV